MVVKEKRKYVLLVLCIGLALIGLVMGAADDSPLGSISVDSPQSAAEFLAELGWECDLAALSAQETVLPEQFDETFIGYNSIQLEQGCDLTKYAGKTVTVLTVTVTNYPNTSDNVLATLIVFRGKVIGGDIHSAAMDGFMHTLK